MSNSTTSNELENNLEKTGLGHFLNHYSRQVTLMAVLALSLIVGVLTYNYQTQVVDVDKRNTTHQLREMVLTPMVKNEITADQAAQKLLTYKESSELGASALEIVFSVVEKLEEKENYDQAIAVVNKYLPLSKNDSDLQFFTQLKLATLYENTQKNEEALITLKELIKSGKKLIQDRIYFDLARVYNKVGDTKMAKEHYQFLIDKHPDSSWTKLAKIAIQKL